MLLSNEIDSRPCTYRALSARVSCRRCPCGAERNAAHAVPATYTFTIRNAASHLMQVLPMNTGVEGGETAIKLARRWGYDVKVRTVTTACRCTFRHFQCACTAPDPRVCVAHYRRCYPRQLTPLLPLHSRAAGAGWVPCLHAGCAGLQDPCHRASKCRQCVPKHQAKRCILLFQLGCRII